MNLTIAKGALDARGLPGWELDPEGYRRPLWSREVWRTHRIYFVQAGASDGPIKVGFTTDVPRRVKQLQTASPLPLKLLEVIVGTHALEAEIHRRLKRHGCHVRGEWFEMGGRDGVRWIVLDLFEDGLVGQ